MNKKILLILLFTAIFSACGDVDLSQVSDEDLERISDKAVVCEKPYLRFGTTCCLDENENGICDKDDREKEESVVEEKTSKNEINLMMEDLSVSHSSDYPLNGDILISGNIDISWSFIEDAKCYDIQLKSINPYTKDESDYYSTYSTCSNNDFDLSSYSLNGLSPENTYYIKLVAKNNNNQKFKESEELIIEFEDWCVDSDILSGKEKNYNKGKTADYGEKELSDDFCKDESTLIEYSCSLDTISQYNYFRDEEEINCPKGCLNGVCMKIDFEEEVKPEFGELKLEVSEKDGRFFIEWNEYNDEENFDYYYVSTSLTDPEIEEKVISTSGLIREIEETEFIPDSFSEGETTYYFWLDLKLNDGTIITSNVVEYFLEETIEYNSGEEGFQQCSYSAIAYNDAAIYNKGSRYEINTEEKCINEFEDELENNENFFCSDTIVKRELSYRDLEDSDFEVILTDECPFDELKILGFGDGEENTITIGSIDYDIKFDDMFVNGIGEIIVGSDSEDYVELYEKVQIGDLYVQAIEILISSRTSVNSYSGVAVANYDFTLSTDDTDEICYENGKSIYDYSSVFTETLDGEFEIKQNYCDEDTLIIYTCNGPNDDLEEESQSCQFGCSNNECNDIDEAVCDADFLSSGSVSFGNDDMVSINGLNFSFEKDDISDTYVILNIDGEIDNFDFCETETVNGVDFIIHEVVKSQRDSVKSYIELSYE